MNNVKTSIIITAIGITFSLFLYYNNIAYWLLIAIQLGIVLFYKLYKRGWGLFKTRYTSNTILFIFLYFGIFAIFSVGILYASVKVNLPEYIIQICKWWYSIEFKDKIQIIALIITTVVALATAVNIIFTRKSLKETRYSRIMQVDTKVFPKISKLQVNMEYCSDQILFLEIQCHETLYDILTTVHDYKGKLLPYNGGIAYKAINEDFYNKIEQEIYTIRYEGIYNYIEQGIDIIDTIDIESNKSKTLFLKLKVETPKVRFIRLDYDSIYRSNFVEIYEIPNPTDYMEIPAMLKGKLVYKKYEWDEGPWWSNNYEMIISSYAREDITIIDYEGPINKYGKICWYWLKSLKGKKYKVQ